MNFYLSIFPNSKAQSELLSGKDPAKSGRAMAAMMKMSKLDGDALKRAYDGA